MTPLLPGLEDVAGPAPPRDWSEVRARLARRPVRLLLAEVLRDLADNRGVCRQRNETILAEMGRRGHPMGLRALLYDLRKLTVEDGILTRSDCPGVASRRALAFTLDLCKGGEGKLRESRKSVARLAQQSCASRATLFHPPSPQVQEPPAPAPTPLPPLNSELREEEETLCSRAREGGGRKPDPPKAGPVRSCDVMARLARLASSAPAGEPALTPRLERWPDPVPAPAPPRAPTPGPYPPAPDTDTAVRRLGNPHFDQGEAVADASSRIATALDNWHSLAFVTESCQDVSAGRMPAKVLAGAVRTGSAKLFTYTVMRWRKSPGAQKNRPPGESPKHPRRPATEPRSSPDTPHFTPARRPGPC